MTSPTLETLVAWATIAGGLALLVTAVVYIVEIKGTTRVLNLELGLLKEKVNLIFDEIFKPQSVTRRRRQPAGRGKS